MLSAQLSVHAVNAPFCGQRSGYGQMESGPGLRHPFRWVGIFAAAGGCFAIIHPLGGALIAGQAVFTVAVDRAVTA